MRLDRLITLKLAARLRSAAAGAPGLPVLMYHSISDDPETGVRDYYRVCTSPARFAAQMRALADAGWRGVTLSEALRSLAAASGPAAARLVALTFDDGFRDFLLQAWPVLRDLGFSATMYLPTASIGDTSPRRFKGRDCLTWDDVRRLHAAGVEFGSHTVSHPVLHGLPAAELADELVRSRAQIERTLGAVCPGFAYPYAYPQADAAFTARFGAALRQAGYASAVTTSVGRVHPGDDRFSLRRLPVNEADDPPFFAAKLAGHYDWFAVPQAAAKRLKRLFPFAAPARPAARATQCLPRST